MSLSDVQNDWSKYRRLVEAMYTGINTPQLMKRAIANIGPFPEDDPGEWDYWLGAYEAIVALDSAVQVTDAALAQEVQFVAATNATAALVVLPAPNHQQVTNLINQLQVINNFIKNDQRFHAALEIGTKLAAAIGTMLSKP
jgi:hypothetical protein